MKELIIATRRGSVLYGVLFDAPKKADTVVIAITGIHGNFYSNPFYYNFGNTLNAGGIDFIYAQTNDAMDAVRSRNVVTGREEIVGSCNERFAWTDEDIEAYLDYAEQAGVGGKTELEADAENGKALYVYMYEKKDGTVYVTKATKSCVIYEDVDTGLSRYPIAWGNLSDEIAEMNKWLGIKPLKEIPYENYLQDKEDQIQ